MQPPESHSITFRFGVPDHSIDVSVLTAAIVADSAIFHRIAREIDPEAKINVMITAPRPGSFEFDFEFVKHAVAVGSWFGSNGTEFFISLIDHYISYLRLNRFAQGKSVTKIQSEGDHTTVINGDNNQVTIHNNVFNVFMDPGTRKLLKSKADRISEDENVDGQHILDEKGNEIEFISRDDYASIADIPTHDETTSRTVTQEAVIRPYNFITSGSKKWTALLGGRPTEFKAKDATYQGRNFYEVLQSGEIAMHVGDAMRVRLSIIQEFVQDLNDFRNHSYEIVEVLDYIPRDEQGELPL